MLNTIEMVDKFRVMGRRVTPQRLAIFKALEGNQGHPTAEDLYHLLAADYPTLTLSTVYQTLKILTEDGAVREINPGGDRRHYDPETRPHAHAVCTSCGVVRDVIDRPDLSLPAGREGFEFTGYTISYQGLCADCRSH